MGRTGINYGKTSLAMEKHLEQLEDLLLAHRLVSVEQLREARESQRITLEPLADLLIRRGFVSEVQILKVLAARAGVAPWNLSQELPSKEAMGKLPIELCRKYQMLPVQVRGDLLMVAMRNPQDMPAIETARAVTGYRIEPVLANETRLSRAIDNLLDGRNHGNVGATVAQAMLEVKGASLEDEETHALGEIDTRPVVSLVNQILADAIRMRASDIHLEPRASVVEVRVRLDGQLTKVQEFPRALLPMVTARIKIMSELDIVEHRLPQDGRITAQLDGRDIDMRVSVLPNHHGARIVLRILDRSSALLPLEGLGFSAHNLGLFRKLITKPYGLILVTGPTGSGKTTSLYAALNEIKDVSRNIMTCEDPIEYDIAGINQSQVNEKVGLTFACQLRAILRQDPDVVLVGEVRDQETAEIAIRASMTGHLVLSTLHTNDAPSAINRLIDIGISPTLLSTSLIGIMAQRLVRLLCRNCRAKDVATSDEAKVLSPYHPGPVSVWRPCGCDACHGTGYKGRLAVNELLPVPSEIQQMISTGAPLEFIRQAGLVHGFTPMQDDAVARVLSGETSFEEAKRVVFFDDLLSAKTQALPKAA